MNGNYGAFRPDLLSTFMVFALSSVSAFLTALVLLAVVG